MDNGEDDLIRPVFWPTIPYHPFTEDSSVLEHARMQPYNQTRQEVNSA